MLDRATEFFFTGAAMLPGVLAYGDEPGLAMMAFVALIVAGGVCAIGDPEAPHHNTKRRRRGQPN